MLITKNEVTRVMIQCIIKVAPNIAWCSHFYGAVVVCNIFWHIAFLKQYYLRKNGQLEFKLCIIILFCFITLQNKIDFMVPIKYRRNISQKILFKLKSYRHHTNKLKFQIQCRIICIDDIIIIFVAPLSS